MADGNGSPSVTIRKMFSRPTRGFGELVMEAATPRVGYHKTGVVLMRIDDEWCVRVAEDDKEAVVTFLEESLVLTFAEAQRRRLGFDRVERF